MEDVKTNVRLTLVGLQDVLGERILIANKSNISANERERNNQQSIVIMGLAKQMINNADIMLRAEALSRGMQGNTTAISGLIGTTNNENK